MGRRLVRQNKFIGSEKQSAKVCSSSPALARTREDIVGSAREMNDGTYMATNVWDDSDVGEGYAKRLFGELKRERRVSLVHEGRFWVLYTHLDDVRIGSSHTSRLASG